MLLFKVQSQQVSSPVCFCKNTRLFWSSGHNLSTIAFPFWHWFPTSTMYVQDFLCFEYWQLSQREVVQADEPDPEGWEHFWGQDQDTAPGEWLWPWLGPTSHDASAVKSHNLAKDQKNLHVIMESIINHKQESIILCTPLYILSVILLWVEEKAAKASRRSSPVTWSPGAGEHGTTGIVAATGELFFWTLYIGLKFISHPGCDLILVAAPPLDANGLSHPALHIF